MEPADDSLEQSAESERVTSSSFQTPSAPTISRPFSDIARPSSPSQPENVSTDTKTSLFRFNKKALLLTGAVFLTVSAIIAGVLLSVNGNKPAAKPLSSNYSVSSIGLDQLKVSDLQVGQNDRLTINGELKLNKGLVLAPGSLPANPQTGQIYLNSDDHKIYYYNGTTFIDLATSDSLSLISGAGIAVNGQSITNTGVTSLQGTPGQITVSQASGAVTLGLPSLPTGQLLLGGGAGALTSVLNGTSGDCLLANGGGSAPSFQTCPSGSAGITGSGTAGQLAKFTSGGAIGDSIISEAGSTITVAGSLTVNSASGNVALLNASQTFTGANIFRSAANSATALQVQTSASAAVFDIDTTNSRIGIGTTGPGYSLDVQGGDVNTSGIYRVNGTQISSANLSNDANLAKLNATNVFSTANTFSTNVTIQGTSSLTLGTSSNVGSIIFRDGSSANSASLRLAGALGASATFQLPVASGTQNICTVELGNCAGSGSGITGSGTANKIAKFNAAQSITDSSITDDGTTVTVSVGQIVQGSAGLTIGASGVNGQLVFKNSSNANTLTLQAGATTANLTLTLPTGDGSNGNCLKTNGSGVLAFAACTGGAGGGVTSINTLTGVVNIVGTANQINVASAGDTITLSLPQDITTAGNVSFRTITLNGVAAGDNLIVGNAITGATGNLLDLKVNSVSKLTVDASGNVNTVAQFQVNGSQISSANLSNDANLAKLDGTGPQTFTGNNKFSGTFLAQNASNSVTSFQIQNAAGTSNLFNADTTNNRIGIGTAAPGYSLDVNGDINTSGVYRINGVTVCSGTSCAAAAGSGNYIQNGTSQQTAANFNIDGSGTLGGTLTAASFSGSGASLTSLNGSNISSGTVADARLSANVTLQGNAFNGASQLVQLTAGGILPVLSGANLTSLNASNLASGTVADARLTANVALLNGIQTFSAVNTFSATPVFSSIASSGTTALCLDGSNNLASCAAAGAVTLQQAYAAGNSISTTDARDINFTLADTATDSNFVINVATGSTSKISVQSNSVETLSISAAGNVITGGGVTAATFSGNGASLTALNGTNISTGTVADARLTTNVTLQGNAFNGASQLVQTTGAGALPAISGVNVTALNGTNIATGTVADARLTTNVTLQGNAFNGASQLVQTTAGGILPVLSGANLTSLNGTNISTGTVANARLTTNVTLQGNAFNGASQLVQLTAGGILPVLSGANLTSLNASNISSGTVADARLSVNVSLLGQTIESAEITNGAVTRAKLSTALIQTGNATTPDNTVNYCSGTAALTVTFAQAFADANYRIVVSGIGASSPPVQSKAAGSFVMSVTCVATNFDYIAIHD